VNFPTVLSRRTAILVPLLTALGRPDPSRAMTCAKVCKNKKDKAKKKKCLQRCKADGVGTPPLPRAASFSGHGPTITGSFLLAAGRYLISATHTDTDIGSGNFIVHLWGPNDYEGFIFNELEFTPGTYAYQTIEEVPYDGSYFYEIQDANSAWTLTMGPI
jgi:hypothetical protein